MKPVWTFLTNTLMGQPTFTPAGHVKVEINSDNETRQHFGGPVEHVIHSVCTVLLLIQLTLMISHKQYNVVGSEPG